MGVLQGKEFLFFQPSHSRLQARTNIVLAGAQFQKLQWYRHTYMGATNEHASFLLGRHWQQDSDIFRASSRQ